MSSSVKYFSSGQGERGVQEIAPLLGEVNSQVFGFGLIMKNVFVCGIAAVSPLSGVVIRQIDSEVFA